MTIGIWDLDGSAAGPHTTGEVLLALVAEIFFFIFLLGAMALVRSLCKDFREEVLIRDWSRNAKNNLRLAHGVLL